MNLCKDVDSIDLSGADVLISTVCPCSANLELG